jgi:hypothetical protein
MILQKPKSFNTAGPCQPLRHYMLPVLQLLPDVREMIEGEYYFLIHAPRLSGKTTLLKNLASEINNQGRMYAVYCSLESLERVEAIPLAISAIGSQLLLAMTRSGVEPLKALASGYRAEHEPRFDTAVFSLLDGLCSSLDKDLIVLIDEADCLAAGPLIPFLRQIRQGYYDRDDPSDTRFPRSLALAVLRNLNDYPIKIRPNAESQDVIRFFDIVKDILTLADFTKDQIETLYRQHTEATGQVFEPSAIERAWYWSEGQPWLVNALADQVVSRILLDAPSAAVTGEHMDQAAEILIRRRDPHLDSLLERLEDPRVRRVVDTAITGKKRIPTDGYLDDMKYTLDLGLLRRISGSGVLRPANPIYSETIHRFLAKHFERPNNLGLTRATSRVDGDKLT